MCLRERKSVLFFLFLCGEGRERGEGDKEKISLRDIKILTGCIYN